MTKANSDNNSLRGSAPRIADDFAAIRNSPLSRVADVAPAATVSALDPLALSSPIAEMIGEIEGIDAECLRLRSTLTDSEEAEIPLDKRRDEIERVIAVTPPTTAADVIAKLRILAHPLTGMDAGITDEGVEAVSVRQSLGWLEQAVATLVVARTGVPPADPLIALDAERRRWRDLCNKAVDDDDTNRFGEAMIMAKKAMFGIPAISIAGALAKFHAADAVDLKDGKPACLCDQLLASAIDDLERLSGGAA